MNSRVPEIIEMYLAGKSGGEIGRKLGISRQRVHQILLKAERAGLIQLRRIFTLPRRREIVQQLIAGERTLEQLLGDATIPEGAKFKILAEWWKAVHKPSGNPDDDLHHIIRRLVPAGASPALIAGITGRSHGDVREHILWLVEEGVIKRPHLPLLKTVSERKFIQILQESESIEEAARRMGLNKGTVSSYRLNMKKRGIRGLKFFRRRYSDEELLAAVNQSASLKEAAEKLGWSASYLSRRLERLQEQGRVKPR